MAIYSMFCLLRVWLRRVLLLYPFFRQGYSLIILPLLYGFGLYDIDPYHSISSLPVPRWQSSMCYSFIFVLSYTLVYLLQPVVLDLMAPGRRVSCRHHYVRLLQLWLLVSLLLCLYKISLHAIQGSYAIEFTMTLKRTFIFGMPFFLLSTPLFQYGQHWIERMQIHQAGTAAALLPVADNGEQLLYIQSDSNYKIIHYWKDGQVVEYKRRISMVALENHFGAGVKLLHCSRSCMVNAAMIDLHASRKLSNTIVLRHTQAQIPVRDTWQKNVRAYLKERIEAEKEAEKRDKANRFAMNDGTAGGRS